MLIKYCTQKIFFGQLKQFQTFPDNIITQKNHLLASQDLLLIIFSHKNCNNISPLLYYIFKRLLEIFLLHLLKQHDHKHISLTKRFIDYATN